MFCRNCGKEIGDNAVACMGCGFNPRQGNHFCNNCGASTAPGQVFCVKCGFGISSGSSRQLGEKNKIVAGILALLLGLIGIHQFYLGNTSSGIWRIVLFVVGAFFFFLGPVVAEIIALIEGIKYLTMSDADFEATYVTHKRSWF